MNSNSKNLIILTGAGFTHNFGGFLGKEMWAKIFNNPLIRAQSRIRDLLLNNFDFEAVYSGVLDVKNEKYTDEEKKNFIEVVEQAYKNLDDAIKDWAEDSRNPKVINLSDNRSGFGTITKDFLDLGQEKILFFTLNQDLFAERHLGRLKSIGTPFFREDFYQPCTNLERSDFVRLPAEENMNTVRQKIDNDKGIIYVKLHGSYGWRSADEKQSAMVLGKNKLEDIKKEPLLNWYYELFEEAVKREGGKLLIIGYGFRDKHINQVILEGIKNNLKLFIIQPKEPDCFRKELQLNGTKIFFREYYTNPEKNPRGRDIGLEIWEAIGGYFPYSLKDIYPFGQNESAISKEIRKAITNH